jgi:hypothetical protein
MLKKIEEHLQSFVSPPNTNFHENPFSSFRVVHAKRQTDIARLIEALFMILGSDSGGH